MEKFKIALAISLSFILSIVGSVLLGFVGIGKIFGVFGILVFPILLIIFSYFLATREDWKKFISTFLIILGIEFILLFPANLLVHEWVLGLLLIYTLPLAILGIVMTIAGVILFFKQ